MTGVSSTGWRSGPTQTCCSRAGTLRPLRSSSAWVSHVRSSGISAGSSASGGAPASGWLMTTALSSFSATA
ncbi:hypothetical protein D3C72_1182990 [compost metagenome]